MKLPCGQEQDKALHSWHCCSAWCWKLQAGQLGKNNYLYWKERRKLFFYYYILFVLAEVVTEQEEGRDLLSTDWLLTWPQHPELVWSQKAGTRSQELFSVLPWQLQGPKVLSCPLLPSSHKYHHDLNTRSCLEIIASIFIYSNVKIMTVTEL